MKDIILGIFFKKKKKYLFLADNSALRNEKNILKNILLPIILRKAIKYKLSLGLTEWST